MHQNHDQISGLSVSNLFICGLKAYLVIFGSQLLNLYNNVAVCRFESHVCDSRTPGYDDPGIRLSNSQGDQRGGEYLSFQKPGNACRTGGRHPAWHEPSCDRRIRRRGRDVRLAAFPQACSVSAAGLASDSIRHFTSTTLSSMQATPTQGIPSADSRCSEFIGNNVAVCQRFTPRAQITRSLWMMDRPHFLPCCGARHCGLPILTPHLAWIRGLPSLSTFSTLTSR